MFRHKFCLQQYSSVSAALAILVLVGKILALKHAAKPIVAGNL